MGRLGAFNSYNLQLANASMEYNPLYNADKGFNMAAGNDIVFSPTTYGAFVTRDNDGYVTIWNAQSRERVLDMPKFENRMDNFWLLLQATHTKKHINCTRRLFQTRKKERKTREDVEIAWNNWKRIEKKSENKQMSNWKNGVPNAKSFKSKLMTLLVDLGHFVLGHTRFSILRLTIA